MCSLRCHLLTNMQHQLSLTPCAILLALSDRLGILLWGERNHELHEIGGFLISWFHWQWQWVRMFHESRVSVVMRRPGVIGDPTPPLPPTLLTQGSAEMRKYCRRRAIINFFVLLVGQHANRCSSSYMSCNSIGWKVEEDHNFNARMAISSHTVT